jgi:hypothetical protein
MVILSNGVQGYIGDWDDVFPPANWMDVTDPYIADKSAYVSPIFDGTNLFGYAMNSDALGHSRAQMAGSTELLFDSTEVERNAVALPSTKPSPPRYGIKNTIALVDGTVIDQVPVTQTPYEASIERMKRMSLATMLYSSDYDDYLPLSSNWMDATVPYAGTETIYHSPIFAGTDEFFGYAMDQAVSGVSLTALENPATTFLFFDSTILIRNANGSPDTRPVPGRYEGKNTWSFCDGHASGD